MHGMKVNDSQYIHSTTLTLDISKVHTWACGETVVLFWYNHHNLQYQQNSSSAFRFFFTASQCSYRSSCLLPLSAPRTLLLCILPFYFLVSHAATRLCACFMCLCVRCEVSSSFVILNSEGLVLHGAEIFRFRMVCSVRSRFLCTHLCLCAFDSDVWSDAQSLNAGLIVSAIII